MLFVGASAFAQDQTALIEQGKRLFVEPGCYGCHAVGKMGTPIGPDLSHVGTQYELSYLTGWLRDPASQKRTAHMPKIELTEQEIQALASYLSLLRCASRSRVIARIARKRSCLPPSVSGPSYTRKGVRSVLHPGEQLTQVLQFRLHEETRHGG
jgi:cytochrome c553